MDEKKKTRHLHDETRSVTRSKRTLGVKRRRRRQTWAMAWERQSPQPGKLGTRYQVLHL